ncbi:MAG: MBL fold metallo-hydrolase [Myxococcota bacterium]|nr:MBL fold metallo-hydrolase [Myxococcota bacterium]
MSAVQLRRNGLHLTGTELWLDARRKSTLSFVSHAHADHIARHERVIATSATVRMMTHRLGKLPAALPVPYHRPFELGPLILELLPAGHMLGSAQLRVTRADGHRVTYTGDLNLAPSMTAEAAKVAECDTLIIESTFGHPRYRFPPKAEVLGAIEAWARANLERGVAPLLLCYPFGKSQEAMAHLASRGLALCAHPSVYEVAKLYEELGVQIPNLRRFEGELRPGEIGVFPPRVARGAAVARIFPRQSAVLTGWALDGPGTARRHGADVAFPLSDHADCQSLIAYARATGATEVITHHGFAGELAQALCEAGVEARPIGAVKQLELF